MGYEKNKIMPLASTEMELEAITPSEVSQTAKDEYRMKPLTHAI